MSPPIPEPNSSYQTHKLAVVTAALLAVAGAVVSFAVAPTSAQAKGWVAALWAVLPLCWFWVEYTYLTTEEQKADKNYLDRLKFAQEAAAKVWLAVGGVFTATYLETIAHLQK